MATRVDIKRDGNGNPALDKTLAGPIKDRLQVGREVLNSLLKKDGKTILFQLGYEVDERAYLSGMFPLLTYKALDEKGGTALSLREPIDPTSSRRYLMLETPRTGVVSATFNKASERYSAIHEKEEDPAKSLRGILKDNSGNLAIARLMIVSHGLIDDDPEMRSLLRGEIPAKRFIDSNAHFASLIRSLHLTSTDTFTRDRTGLTSGIVLDVQNPDGSTNKHIWRNIGYSDKGIVLGRVVRTKTPKL